MTEVLPRHCTDLKAAGYDEQKAADDTWDALHRVGAFVEGDFTLASGSRATLKVEADYLYRFPGELCRVLGHAATYPCVKEADTLLYVPKGMKDFTTVLGEVLKIPVAHTEKIPGVRYGFRFSSEEDKRLALAADRPVIMEDVISTAGSIAGVRALLDPEQDVHALALLTRGDFDPLYAEDTAIHHLVNRYIPKDKDAFNLMQKNSWMQ